MKWIGQHIWSFISRFRDDVYLEATETGTIASGGNLGLDANNKIVKADTETGELTQTNSGDDRIITSVNSTTINAEQKLQFSNISGIMKIGGDDSSSSTIMKQLHTSDDGGSLLIQAGSPTIIPSSSNKSGGDLILQGGFHTGSGTASSIILKTPKGAGGSATGVVLQTPTVSIKGTNVHLEEDVTLSFEGGSDNGHETILTVVDPSADRTITLPNATGTVALTSDLEAGWHGSTTRIKILPRDFVANDGGRPVMIEDDSIGSNELFLFSFSSFDMFAYVPIPTGYKATHVRIYGSDTGQDFYVYEGDINSKTITDVATGSTSIGTEKTLGTEVTSDTTNYLIVRVTSDGATDEIHGGYVTIAAV